jgi:ribonuclease BN (tRNA processing enzyme)
MLMDAMLAAKRDRPLTIAAPRETMERMKTVATALMPGMHVMTPKFAVTYMDLEVLQDHQVGPLKIRTFPAVHTKDTNPTSLRVAVADRVIAYTGDSEWTEHMPALADGADLFTAESYYLNTVAPRSSGSASP